MQRTFYFTDMDVLQEDLNNTEDTKIEEMQLRSQYPLTTSGGVYGNDPSVSASILGGGVFGDPNEYDNASVQLYVTKNSATQMTVAAGAAMDVNGELIIVPSSKVLNFGGGDANYTWTLLGGPFTIAQYFVKLNYAEVTGSIKTNDAGTPYPTRYTRSWFIRVDDKPPSADEVLLASFIGDTSAHITGSIKDERLYVRPIVPASGVRLDPTTKPVSAWESVEDHVNSVGSGTPSSTNPHGLTGNDIGLSDTTQPHRLEAHTAGIVDVTSAYDGGTPFYDSYEPVLVNNGTGNAGINFTAPHSSASIIANGQSFTGALTNIVFSTHPDILAGGDGTYTFYFDNSSGSVVKVEKNLTVPDIRYRSSERFYLCEVYVYSVGTQYAEETFVDYREFYESNPHKQGADNLELVSNSAITKASTLADNLARIRYMLGLALTGDPNDWADGFNPLTDGVSSNASAYHEHRSINHYYFEINTGGLVVDSFIRFTRPGNPVSPYLGWRGSVNAFAAMETYSPQLYAKMIVGSLQVNTDILTQSHVAAMPTLTGGSSSNADALHTHDNLAITTGSVVAGYTFGQMRRNTGTGPMFVIITSNNVNTGVYSAYLGPTSGSAIVNVIGRQAYDTSEESMSIVVPPGWYFKFQVTSGTSAGVDKYAEYPQNGVNL